MNNYIALAAFTPFSMSDLSMEQAPHGSHQDSIMSYITLNKTQI